MPEYQMTVELVDDYNRLTRKLYRTVDTIADEDEATTAATSLIGHLEALSELRVLAYTLGQRHVISDTVVTGANKDEGVTFTLLKIDNRKDDLKVPGPINAIFDENGNVILTNTAVVNYIAHFLSGTGDWTFSDGEQATEIVKGTLDK